MSRPRILPAAAAALAAAVVLAATVAAQAPAAGAARAPIEPPLAEPSLSPDGREIAFVSGGDIWTVPAAGGEARLLVSHPAADSRPLWSPDGTRLAFGSARTGNGDVYVLMLGTGELRRLTFDDGADLLDAWSPDGQSIYYSSSARDVAGMSDVYRVAAGGGTPMPVAADRYAAEYWGAPSPDGRALVVAARGFAGSQWWRHGRSHLDENELWVVEGGRYAQLVPRGAKNGWPQWAPDGRTLYFTSDRGGPENLWALPVGADRRAAGEARQLTRFTDGRVLWASAARDGRTIVFERDFGVWAFDVARGEARRVPITLRGAAAGAPVEHVTVTGGFTEMALAPDGKKVAVVARGEVFVAATAAGLTGAAAAALAGGDAVRVTATPELEGQLAWAPDSRRLAYASRRGGRWSLYLYDFATREERRLGEGDGPHLVPRWSPDGRQVAFVSGTTELRVADAATGRSRVVATGTFERPPFLSPGEIAWSPDGRWIAFASVGAVRGFTNVFVVPSAGGTARQVTFVSNVFGGQLAWSGDGTQLYMSTGQRTESGQVARVDLVPRTPRFREDQFRDLFGPPAQVPTPPGTPADTSRRAARRGAAGTAADSTADTTRAAGRGAAAAFVFEGVRQRMQFLPTGLDVGAIAVSPDGRQLLLTASAAGQTNLYTYPLDELSRDEPVARQLTSTGTNKSEAQWSPDGKDVYFLDNGRPSAITVESRASRTVAVTAELDVDFSREKHEVFAQAWDYSADNFYDDKYHGADWRAARTRWTPVVAATRSPDELRRVLSLMVGELNASHLGVGAPGGQAPTTGRLGVRWDAAAHARDGALVVSEVIPLGPAALAGVRAGDRLVAVEGRALAAADNLDERLAYRIGRRTALTLADARGARREVAVRPSNLQTEKGLLYRSWVESRRAYVDSASGGRLGYVHMFDMGAGSLAQLHADLDAQNQAKEGVVVDVRNNNGGFVNAYALDVIARRPYLTMQWRGRPEIPARTALGQRALELPTALVTNQHSLSDAEDFAEGYRALGLGPIVGEPTAGWIIFTSNVPLVDGTVLRLPFIRIRGADGKDMELAPRPVDVRVDRPMGEWATGRDTQLDAAIRALTGRLMPAPPARGGAGR